MTEGIDIACHFCCSDLSRSIFYLLKRTQKHDKEVVELQNILGIKKDEAAALRDYNLLSKIILR